MITHLFLVLKSLPTSITEERSFISMDSIMQINQFAVAINKDLCQAETHYGINGSEAGIFLSYKLVHNRELCTMNKTVGSRKH
jgi:hypothetical protein